MTAKRAPRRKPRPRVVVAGDVCIDWLSIPVESVVAEAAAPNPMNWQIRGGRHLYAGRGGAWLTADFVKAALDSIAIVSIPESMPHLESVPPEQIVHSMLLLGSFERERNNDKVPYWAVTSFSGYAGPPYPKKPSVNPLVKQVRNPRVVLLDDSGNGFRDHRASWEWALEDGNQPLVLYKVRRPLCQGALWKNLAKFHSDRTIVLLSGDELRGEGCDISRGLSWERTATDLILSLMREPKLRGLLKCPFLIVTLGIEAAMLVRCDDGRVDSAHLWYFPNRTEGELLRMKCGDMSGFGSAFAAAITASVLDLNGPKELELNAMDRALKKGIPRGLLAMQRLLDEAFGPCHKTDKKKRKVLLPPHYPATAIFRQGLGKPPKIADVPLPDLSKKQWPLLRDWRILESKRTGVLTDTAADVVRRGVDKVFEDVPVGKFGKLVTLDRWEIESYRGIANLIREFLNTPRPERPLCLAVFGAPGSGKSFGVTQVASSLDSEEQIEKVTFNVSQWTGPEYLVNALHQVRDHAIRGKVPLVFFDEFDSQLGVQKLGWLKYFLAPMQDGVFADGLFTHEIGKAIFVFAGGTATSFADFEQPIKGISNQSDLAAEKGAVGESKAQSGTDSQESEERENQTLSRGLATKREDLKNAKLPDFISRLRGHVDVFGLGQPANTNLLRRALVVRSNILKKFPTLKDGSEMLRIDDGVLRAFLQVPEYRHGARSLEAVLDMSHLVGRKHFDPSLLPPQNQLQLHVDESAFTVLVHQRYLISSTEIERMAEVIHEFYLERELAKTDTKGHRLFEIGDRPSLQHWKRLPGVFKNSNREQVANYPSLLGAVKCGIDRGTDPQHAIFEFEDHERKKLARMEHDRWMEERRIKQPQHPDLRPWEDLTTAEQEKDVHAIQEIPGVLRKVGLRVVRLL